MAALSDALVQFYSIFGNQPQPSIVEQAAYSAFGLPSTPDRSIHPRLFRIFDNWARGDFASINSLPSIRIIDQNSIAATWAGAYSDQTNTIYLNRSWIEQSTVEQLLYVIIHEIGHFLDREYWDDLGGGDAPGEEGHQFAVELYGLLGRELPTGFLIAEQTSPVVANIVEGLAYIDAPSSPIEEPRSIQVGPDGSYYSIMRTFSGTGEVLDADGLPYIGRINETHHLVSIRQDGSIDGTFGVSIPGRVVINQYSGSFMLENGDAILLMSDKSAYRIPTIGLNSGQIDQSFSSQFSGSLDVIGSRILLPNEQMTISEYTASGTRMLLSIATQDPDYLYRYYIAAILSDGSLDTSFGEQGIISIADYPGRLTQLGSGIYSMGDGSISLAPIRYSLAGILQPPTISSPFGTQYFSEAPGVEYQASTTGITEFQGKLYTYGTLSINTLVFGVDPSGSGNSPYYENRLTGFVIRWNADMTPDISFGRNGLFITPQALGQERALKLFSPDPESLTLVIENSSKPSPDQPYDLPSTIGYYYITSSGNLDVLKGASGFVAARAESGITKNNDDHVAAMDAQGRLVIGSMTNPSSQFTGTPPMDGYLYRLLPDGSADNTFGPTVTVAVELSEVLALQSKNSKAFSGESFVATGTTTSGSVTIIKPTSTTRGVRNIASTEQLFNVDELVLTGSNRANLFDLSRWSGDAVVNAQDGMDTVVLGLGLSSVSGGAGADRFRFVRRKTVLNTSTADHITDFVPSSKDRIEVSRVAFGISRTAKPSLANVALSDQVFGKLSTPAMFVYCGATGELWFNQNGSAPGEGIGGGVIAVLDAGPAVLPITSIGLF